MTETHIHADFVSGARALAEAAGARLLLSGDGGELGRYHYADAANATLLHDGDAITVGAVRLDVLHVPGHTPEHLAFVVTDTATADLPMGIVSGDFVFVGDVGRPDLLERAVRVQGTMRDSAAKLYASLARLRTLPDWLQLWPGHGAGSACGKALGAVPQSTLGYERRTNWALAADDEARFIDGVLAGQPEPPAYFARMKHANAHGPAPMPALRALDDAALRAALDAGVLLVDVRPTASFRERHVRGAVSLPLGKSFLNWAGSVLPVDRDVVLLAEPATRDAANDAARDLALIGIDRVLGVLAPGSVDALALETASLESRPMAALDPAKVGDAVIVDVRNGAEWSAGHVPGARHLPLAQLPARLEELRGQGPLLLHCQGGSRSVIAASLLRAAGIDDVVDLGGGYGAWAAAGHTPARDDA